MSPLVKILLSIFVFFYVVCFPNPLKAEKDNYYIHYGAGNYVGAMATASSGFLLTNNDTSKAVSLFRIYEAARFHEDILKAVEYLDNLSWKINKKDNLELYSLQQILIMNLYGRLGDSSKLFQVRKKAAFITEMQLLGPLEISESLSLMNPGSFKMDHIYSNKYKGMDIFWRKINSDDDGVFRVNNYYKNVSKTGFVAEENFLAQEEGTYHLFIGSSGNIICEVNGNRVYESVETMKIFPSQIHVKLNLSQGSHTIRIKTKGNNRNICSFSIQLFDKLGNPISGITDIETRGVLKSFSFLLGNCLSLGHGFSEKYIRHMSGLGIINESFDSEGKSDDTIFYPYFFYYQALEESDPANIERKLKSGLALSPNDPLLMEQLANLKLRFNRVEECSEIISRFEKYPQSPVGIILSVEFALNQSWYEEALSLCENLSVIGYPYTADKSRVECWNGLEDANKAFDTLKLLFLNGVYTDYASNEISKAVSKGMRHNAALTLVDSVISKERNNMQLRMLLAESYLEKNEPNTALVYLIHVAKFSPCRDDVFFLIGRCYEKMKKYDLATYYYNQARKLDTENRLYNRIAGSSE